jgi:hypothetical protein
MRVIKPTPPPIDLDAWSQQHERDRVLEMCRWWAVQGFGAPLIAYLFYVFKIAFYVWLWTVFVGQAPELAGLADIDQWWADPVAFQKAIIWTMLFEIIGLGCGSGPLTGRYVPPIVAVTHFLRPGTIRLPAFPDRVPGTRGDTRTVLDVILYIAIIGFALRALLAPVELLGMAELLPLAILLPLLGLRDKTAFLAARGEHYWSTIVVFVVAGDDITVMIAGAAVVHLSIWWGAATSKLNRHFPSVVAIMVSNSPVLPFQRLKRAMYKDFPADLRPSRLAASLAHGGTVIEYLFPLILVVSMGGTPTTIALVVMLCFHVFIMSCFPMGVPMEWNVLFLYSMFVLFGANADVSLLEVFGNPLLVVLLVAGLLAGPVLGNLRPGKVSFLPSMRYYAGNWAASLWLFRPGCYEKLDDGLVKTAKTLRKQLEVLYEEDTIQAVLGKLRAFRSMHLHGRALNALLYEATADAPGGIDDYEIQEGEGIAGIALGWNFGDGHLHHEQLLAAVQDRCGFAPGELRCIFLESQPLNRPDLHWRIVDAADGLVAEGHVVAADLQAHPPFPEEGAVDLHRAT